MRSYWEQQCWSCYSDEAELTERAGRFFCSKCCQEMELDSGLQQDLLTPCFGFGEACSAVPAGPSLPLCDVHERAAAEALARCIPALLERMTDARAEFESWLETDNWPSVQWTIVDEEGDDELPDTLADEVAERFGYSSRCVAFVDPKTWAKFEKDESPSRSVPGAWTIPQDGETIEAWRDHLAPFLAKAITDALASFPASHAKREVRNAIREVDGYGPEQNDGVIECIAESATGLSDDADTYFRMKYDTDPTYMCHLDEPAEYWERFGVLDPVSLELVQRIRAFEARYAERCRLRRQGE